MTNNNEFKINLDLKAASKWFGLPEPRDINDLTNKEVYHSIMNIINNRLEELDKTEHSPYNPSRNDIQADNYGRYSELKSLKEVLEWIFESSL